MAYEMGPTSTGLHGCFMKIFVLNRYQWFCHADDDVYINVPKLSRFLQQYDPRKPYYVGKWPYYFYPRPTYGVSANPLMYCDSLLY